MTQPALPQEVQRLLALPNVIRVPDHHARIRDGFHSLNADQQQEAIEKARGFLTDGGSLRPGREPIDVLDAIKEIARSIPT